MALKQTRSTIFKSLKYRLGEKCDMALPVRHSQERYIQPRLSDKP